jgi:hypothetical protein
MWRTRIVFQAGITYSAVQLLDKQRAVVTEENHLSFSRTDFVLWVTELLVPHGLPFPEQTTPCNMRYAPIR